MTERQNIFRMQQRTNTMERNSEPEFLTCSPEIIWCTGKDPNYLITVVFCCESKVVTLFHSISIFFTFTSFFVNSVIEYTFLEIVQTLIVNLLTFLSPGPNFNPDFDVIFDLNILPRFLPWILSLNPSFLKVQPCTAVMKLAQSDFVKQETRTVTIPTYNNNGDFLFCIVKFTPELS